jgi:hypothetical protein
MRRGCIAIGEMKCSLCQGSIDHGQRYLLIEDETKSEALQQILCVDCSLKKKYAVYIKEKGEQILTFFPGQ